MSKIRWGILGTGRVTHRMVDAMAKTQHGIVSAVASRSLERAEAWVSNQALKEPARSGIHAYGDYAALLDDPKITWIYNALPPSLHFDWTMQCLAAGKNVLCEKPLVLNHREASQLQSEAQLRGRRLIDATAYPYHPRSLAAKAIIDSDELGSLCRVTVACTFGEIFERGNDHRVDAGLGGGCLLDLGWYCVHATMWLTGCECLAVQAIGSKRNGVWNHVQVLAELSKGLIAHWDCGFDATGRKWIEIAGRKASWICDDFIRPWDLMQPRFWVHGATGKARGEVHAPDFFQEVAMLDACMSEVSESSYVGRSLALAVETHRILDAIDHSANTRARVEIG
jgi:dTDP-3,4-didehydro-2,6-dideoxy-alpha-D-glucose 3-reductase